MRPRSAFVRPVGASLLALGVILLVAGMLAPTEGASVQLASHPTGDAPPPEAPPASAWRDAVLLAGGICLAAGAGLIALSLVPRDTRAR